MEANRKRVQVHMLPTEDKSDIQRSKTTNKFFYKISNTFEKVYQHLYFTTDEKIKESDWFINTNFQKIYQGNSENSKSIIEFGPHPEIRKIIATTDPELELPQPSQALIKAYCEQGGIDEVDVEYWIVEKEYSITKKREIEIKVDPIHNTITTHRIVEKMYSISDIEAYCKEYSNDTELGREIRKLRYKQ